MQELLYVVVTTARYIVVALQVLLIVRAVLSWLPLEEGNVIDQIVYVLTEPFIIPVRALLDHFGLFQDIPIDMSSLFTFIILSIVEMFLVL